MNILEIHNLRKCPARGTSLLLNGEDVTNASHKVEILPDRILLHRFELPVRPRSVHIRKDKTDRDNVLVCGFVTGDIVSYTTEIDELKIH